MKRMGVGGWIALALGVALIVLIVLRVLQATSPDEPPPTVEEIREAEGVPVAIASAVRGELEVWRAFDGTVSGVRDAVVRARTNDPVVEVRAAVGDQVAEGEVLVRVEGPAAEARLRQARAAYAQANRLVERLHPLHEEGAISDQELENALTQRELAASELSAAREALTLTSPLSGTVTEVNAREGMIPDPGAPLVLIADLSMVVVRARVSPSDARRIEVGRPARLPADEVSNDEAMGEVERIALQADPLTRLVEVEIMFPREAGLVPGTFETVEVRLDLREDVIHLPEAALDDEGVWVVVGDRAERREVVAGVTADGRVEVVEGLEEGERVVIEGATLLEDGSRVRVLEDGGER